MSHFFKKKSYKKRTFINERQVPRLDSHGMWTWNTLFEAYRMDIFHLSGKEELLATVVFRLGPADKDKNGETIVAKDK